MGPRAPLRPWTAKRIFLASLLVLSIALGAYLSFRFVAVGVGLFLAIVIATALRPAVARLEARGLGRIPSAAIVYAAVCILVGGGLALVVPPVVREVGALFERFPQFARRWASVLSDFRAPILRDTGHAIGRSLLRWASETPLATVSEGIEWARAIGRSAFTVLSVLLLGFFWLVDGDAITRRLLFLVPVDRRDFARDLVSKAEDRLGAYVRGQALLCVIVGALSFGAYVAMGLPYAALLAVLACVFEALPVLGPWIGAAPACALALLVRPSLAIWVLAATAAIHLLESYVLFPRVMARSIGMNPMVTLLAIVAFWSLLGVVGAVLAIPIAAVVQLAVEEWVARRQNEVAQGIARDERAVVSWETRRLLADTRNVLRAGGSSDETPPDGLRAEDRLEALVADLDRIVGRDSATPAESR